MDRNDAPRAERRRLTHVDRRGRPRMVDVSGKPSTARRAVAEAEGRRVRRDPQPRHRRRRLKGDVLTVAELAGVMGGKRTAELIPLCHPLPLTDLVVTITPDRASSVLRIRAEAATTGPTGVEMEAMTAASVAALTVYDMVKGVERGVEIRSLRLLSKTGGKSGEWHRPAPPVDGALQAAAQARRADGGARRAEEERMTSGAEPGAPHRARAHVQRPERRGHAPGRVGRGAPGAARGAVVHRRACRRPR